MSRIIYKNISLIITSALICLVILELVARIFYEMPSSKISDFSLSKSDFYQKDEELVFVPRKNIKGSHDRQGSFSTTFQTNSRGLRDKEYPLKKPDGIKRIVVVGDSFTWGFGVNDNEIYTEKLESLLQNTEVINLGVTAYQLWNEIRYFKREGLQYNPDILIVGLCLNDFIHEKVLSLTTENTSNNDVDGMILKVSPTTLPFSFRLKHHLKNYLFNKSAFLTFISNRISTNKTLVKLLASIGMKEITGFKDLDINLMPALKNYPEPLISSWDKTKYELLEFKRIALESGIRLIIAVIPSVQTIQDTSFRHAISHSVFDKDDFDLDKPYRMLKEFALANNIEIIIPVNAFREINKKGQPLYLKRDMHFNAAGHDLFAHEIADYLSEYQLLIN